MLRAREEGAEDDAAVHDDRRQRREAQDDDAVQPGDLDLDMEDGEVLPEVGPALDDDDETDEQRAARFAAAQAAAAATSSATSMQTTPGRGDSGNVVRAGACARCRRRLTSAGARAE